MTLQKYAGLLQGIGLPKFSQSAPHSFITDFTPVIYSVFEKHGSGAKETASHFACLARQCRAATRSAIASMSYGLSIMIYTFLITVNRGRIADIQRIRTISAFANSETEARQRLAGLPLIFVSRSPAQEVAA